MISEGITYRVISLTMAFLLLFSSVGFSVDMHYCQDHLKSIGVFSNAETCYEMSGKTCINESNQPSDNKECSINKKNCCHNEMVQFQVDQELRTTPSITELSNSTQQFLFAYASVLCHVSSDIELNPQSYNYYKPPLPDKDIPLLFQSFLI